MKKKIYFVKGIIVIALAAFTLTGCIKKDSGNSPANNNSTSGSNDISAAQDESNASDAMNDSKNISDAAAQSNGNQYRPERNIAVIAHCTIDTVHGDSANGFTDTMYINFGPKPVLCNDKRWRQGEIVIYWNGGAINIGLWRAYFDSSNVIHMTFNNYAVGNYDTTLVGIAGTRSWTNTGRNLLSQQNWKFDANLTLTYPNKQTATWNSSRTNSLVKQNGDYYYEINGTASGVDRNSVHYSLTITTPLYVTALPLWAGGCPWIESGVIDINLANNINMLSVNFGTLGICTPVKTATINNHTYTFIMW